MHTKNKSSDLVFFISGIIALLKCSNYIPGKKSDQLSAPHLICYFGFLCETNRDVKKVFAQLDCSFFAVERFGSASIKKNGKMSGIDKGERIAL